MSNDWQEFPTNQTINYRQHWGEWEAVREIIQNGLDETEQIPELIIDKVNNRTIIADKGQGINFNQLVLLGKTEKDGENSRGRFGEGIKIALIVLTRMGYKVRIISKKGFEAETFSKEFGEDRIFALKWREIDYAHYPSGTTIVIEGFIPTEDWTKRFNRGNKPVIFTHEGFSTRKASHIIREEKPCVYVKNIFVQRRDDLIWSYDLWNVKLEESRNIPDENSLRLYMGELIGKIDDEKLIEEFFKCVGPSFFEFRTSLSIPYKNYDLWKKTFKKVFGNKSALTTSPDLIEKANYHGIKAVVVSLEMYYSLNGIGIPDLSKELKKIDEEREYISEQVLTPVEKDNLRRAKIVLKMACKFEFDYPLKIFETKGKVLGYSSFPAEIGICRKVLNSLSKTAMVLLEEAIHYEYRVSDVTAQFQQIFVSKSGDLVDFLLQTKEIKFND